MNPIGAWFAFKPVVLWSDALIFLLLLAGAVFLAAALRREHWRVAFRQIAANRLAMASFLVLCLYGASGFLDTLHFIRLGADGNEQGSIQSVLDVLAQPLVDRTEKTYSAPLAATQFSKETFLGPDGRDVHDFPRLQHGGSHLLDPAGADADIRSRLWRGGGYGLGIGLCFLVLCPLASLAFGRTIRGGAFWGAFLAALSIFAAEVLCLGGFFDALPAGTDPFLPGYHVLGTDKVGKDVLYMGLKSIRTGLVIGTLTTLIVTPFAILFGVLAGYFGGWVDDVIQYVYTTIASVPEILLISAAMLIVEVGIKSEETIRSADKRLLWLCVIMGITSWTGLCRLIRGEVLKLREVEFVQAADAFGVSRVRILMRHLVPNVMHIVLIKVVLRFSGLGLAEAGLSYGGIGVDPSMESWGNMINQSRLELARDPIVWWNLFAAFVFMFGLVLPANLFGDAVRDALDPRLRTR
ncbi:MAG: ABC transporter permease [Planctomycetota bacterium]|mgnify:FL=1